MKARVRTTCFEKWYTGKEVSKIKWFAFFLKLNQTSILYNKTLLNSRNLPTTKTFMVNKNVYKEYKYYK